MCTGRAWNATTPNPLGDLLNSHPLCYIIRNCINFLMVSREYISVRETHTVHWYI